MEIPGFYEIMLCSGGISGRVCVHVCVCWGSCLEDSFQYKGLFYRDMNTHLVLNARNK